MNDLPLKLFGVLDPAVPNLERVALWASTPVNAAEYALLIGTGSADLNAVPFRDNFFWLGTGTLPQHDWIFVYSGHGENRVDTLAAGNKLHSIYWNRNSTLFYTPYIVPILIQIGGYSTVAPEIPQPLPQYPSTSPSPNKLAGLINSQQPKQ